MLTERSNSIIRKVLKSLLMVIFLLLCLALIKHSSPGLMEIPIASAVICLILMLFFKSYKVIGKITFETNLINVELTNQTIKLPFNTIRQIKFIFQGRKRNSYRLSAIQPIGVNMADGTGNRIVIETEATNYELDIFLKNSKNN